MALPIAQFYQKLDYQFKDEQLLVAALSHRSVRGVNYERLEFLGDSIVNFIIAEELFHQCPQAKEGELSRLRAQLVCRETLAIIAQQLDVSLYLRLGGGELKSGGARRHSILADALEAIIAAIYLDADLTTCRQCVLAWFGDKLDRKALSAYQKDAKTRLQEYLQARKYALPIYEITAIEGEAHEQQFCIVCRVDGLPYRAEGEGSSRRRAEQEAAEKYLALVVNDD